MIELREYQQRGVADMVASTLEGRKPVLYLPTGSGKSLAGAAIVAQLPGRALVLAHRQELLTQNEHALNTLHPEITTGIYSAGLGRRDTDARVIFGGVQSVYRNLEELQTAGPFMTVLIDEAHRVAPKSEAGIMYRAVLDALPLARLMGMTATPYRLDGGLLYEGEDAWFNACIKPTSVVELVRQGYLAPLVGISAANRIDTNGVHVRRGDFIASELAQVACDTALINATVAEVLHEAGGRQSVIVFCITVDHAETVQRSLVAQGEHAELLTGEKPQPERKALLSAFATGEVRWLINIDVASTGFDIPRVDCIVSLRPTLSKSLWVQQIGRGCRLSPATGKQDCLILDHAGNIRRHGAADYIPRYTQRKTPAEIAIEEAMRRAEEARQRREEEAERARRIRHDIHADPLDPMTGITEAQVYGVSYQVAPAARYPGKNNLVAQYSTRVGPVRQWVCLEYQTGARWHAKQWFRRRGLDMPDTAIEAADLLQEPHPVPSSLSIRYEESQPSARFPTPRKFPTIVVEHFEEETADA